MKERNVGCLPVFTVDVALLANVVSLFVTSGWHSYDQQRWREWQTKAEECRATWISSACLTGCFLYTVRRFLFFSLSLLFLSFSRRAWIFLDDAERERKDAVRRSLEKLLSFLSPTSTHRHVMRKREKERRVIAKQNLLETRRRRHRHHDVVSHWDRWLSKKRANE